MIEKILDSYYVKKLTNKLEHDLNENWNLDFEIIRTKHAVAIHAKPRKHKNYTCVYAFMIDEAIFVAANYYKYLKTVNDIIRAIDKDNGWN